MSDEAGDDQEGRTVPTRHRKPGRRQGRGDWLERQVAGACCRWSYCWARNCHVFGYEVDVVASRGDPGQDRPSDYLVFECKDWADGYITRDVITRLCLLGFTLRAMPVLVTTTRLTKRAWRTAVAYNVRLLTLNDLQAESLPDLESPRMRPQQGAPTETEADDVAADPEDGSPEWVFPHNERGTIPHEMTRSPELDLEAPVFKGSGSVPGYVADRTGHKDDTQSLLSK